jgi:pyruvate, water dikinase
MKREPWSGSGILPAPLFIKRFADITINDIPTVGGKTASLGEMFRELRPQGVRVPDGFAITAHAYRHFLREGGLEKRIETLTEGLDTRDIDALRKCGAAIREEILAIDRRATNGPS